MNSFIRFTEHPGAGGIRFQLPKRQKMQQQQNSFSAQKQSRFMGPRGPRPQMGMQDSQQQGIKTPPDEKDGKSNGGQSSPK